MLCIHALKHDLCRPQWLCDIAAAVEHRPADFSWSLLLGENPRHAGWIACAIGLAHHLLGADIAGTPLESAAERMPRWLLPSVIKVWDDPSAYRIVPQELFADALRHPARIPAALRQRWPKPVHASIVMDAPFNDFPRLPIQVALYRPASPAAAGSADRGAGVQSARTGSAAMSAPRCASCGVAAPRVNSSCFSHRK